MGIKINTPVGRTAFLSIFEKKVWNEKDEPAFEATFLFDKESDLAEITKACKAMAKEEFGTEKVEYAWGSGDDCTNEEGEVYNGFEGKIYLRTKSKFSIIIIDQKKRPIDSSESDRFQSGDYAIAQVEIGPWTFAKKKGVSCYLKAVQLVKKGERFQSDGVDLDSFGELEEDTASGDLF